MSRVVLPLANRLLARLSAKDRGRVIGASERVDLAPGEILAEPGEPVRNIYFPTGSVISLVVPMGGKSMP